MSAQVGGIICWRNSLTQCALPYYPKDIMKLEENIGGSSFQLLIVHKHKILTYIGFKHAFWVRI